MNLNHCCFLVVQHRLWSKLTFLQNTSKYHRNQDFNLSLFLKDDFMKLNCVIAILHVTIPGLSNLWRICEKGELVKLRIHCAAGLRNSNLHFFPFNLETVRHWITRQSLSCPQLEKAQGRTQGAVSPALASRFRHGGDVWVENSLKIKYLRIPTPLSWLSPRAW